MFISIVSFLFVFTIIALSHELGHFIWAKRAGIRVYEFGVGFGPRLYSVTKNGTIYSLNLIPVLAYVKIAGEGDNEEDKSCPENEKYTAKTAAQKFKAIVAGPLMNILAAFLILFLSAAIIGEPKSLSNEINMITKNSQAEKAGLKIGDRLIAINGRLYPKTEEAINFIHLNADKRLVLTIQRGSQTLKLAATPKYNPAMKAALLGFAVKPVYEKVDLFSSFLFGLEQTLSLVAVMFVVLFKLFTGSLAISNLAGPLGIAQITGKYALSGWVALLNLTALISVNIGVLNLLPLPALDGGRLVFIALELIRKKPVSPELENKIHFWGFVVLLSLMALITFNDFLRLLKGS